MALVPAHQATIEPTWDTLGLRGTASHHIDFGDEVAIPAAMTYTWPMLTIERPGTLATAIRPISWMISLSAAATNLGVARHASAAATTAAGSKQRRFDAVPVAQQATFMRGVAELHGTVDLAVAGLRALLDDLWREAGAGIAPSPQTRARLRLAAARAVSLSADVVREAQGLAGADASTGPASSNGSGATARCWPTTSRSTPPPGNSWPTSCTAPTKARQASSDRARPEPRARERNVDRQTGVTATPTGAWATQAARNLLLRHDERPAGSRALVRHRGTQFVDTFGEIFRTERFKILTTPIRTPLANSFAERWIGSIDRSFSTAPSDATA